MGNSRAAVSARSPRTLSTGSGMPPRALSSRSTFSPDVRKTRTSNNGGTPASKTRISDNGGTPASSRIGDTSPRLQRSVSGRSRPASAGATRNPSLSRQLSAKEVDKDAVLSVSQQSTDELAERTLEKDTLLRLLKELKQYKLAVDTKYANAKSKANATMAKVAADETRCATMTSSNIVRSREVETLINDNTKLQDESQLLKESLAQVVLQLKREKKRIQDAEKVKTACRKEMQIETKAGATTRGYEEAEHDIATDGLQQRKRLN